MTGTATTEKDGVEAIQPSPEVQSNASSALDETYEVFKNHHELETDPAETKKVLRKIDKRVVPVLFFIYMLQYLDKNGINYASAWGLQKGTNLVGDDYAWLGPYISPSLVAFAESPTDDYRKAPFSTSVTSPVSTRQATSSNGFPSRNSSAS